MSINSRVVQRTPPQMPRGIAVQGYRQISKKRGLKDSAATWGDDPKCGWRNEPLSSSLALLRRSKNWRQAKKEFNTQLKAYNAGLAPKPVRLGVLRRGKELTPALWMEHIEGMELCQATYRGFIDYEEKRSILAQLWKDLKKIGVDHHDLHDSNVLVTFVKGKRKSKKTIKRIYAIDFELSHLVKKRKKAKKAA